MTLRRLMKAALALGLAVSFHFATAQTQAAQQPGQAPATGSQQAPRAGGPFGAVDPRAQQRTYLFQDTNEQLPYKELNMTHQYLEIAGGMPQIFKFFGSHSKPAR